MHTHVSLVLLAVIGLGLSACSSHKMDAPVPSAVVNTPPASASLVDPLKEGQAAPTATLHKPNGKEVDMASLYASKPTVLIFYRGGWCPYCNTQLSEIAKAEAELVKLGFQVVAVSPDRPEALKTTLDKGNLQYQLLSDSKMDLAKAYGLAFRVDNDTVTKYHTYGIDLDKASGESHHLLPVPAVYIVDRRGVIQFAQWNPDYKVRMSNDELLKTARNLMSK